MLPCYSSLISTSCSSPPYYVLSFLQIPSRDGHPALRSTADCSPASEALPPLSDTALLIRAPRGLQPPDSRAAQHTLRTHPSPSRLRSISRLSQLYDLPCSDDFSSGREGLLQLLGMSLSPCCRFHPAEVLEPRRSAFGSPCCLRPTVAGSAFGATHFRGHFCVHCCYGPVARRLP